MGLIFKKDDILHFLFSTYNELKKYNNKLLNKSWSIVNNKHHGKVILCYEDKNCIDVQYLSVTNNLVKKDDILDEQFFFKELPLRIEQIKNKNIVFKPKDLRVTICFENRIFTVGEYLCKENHQFYSKSEEMNGLIATLLDSGNDVNEIVNEVIYRDDSKHFVYFNSINLKPKLLNTERKIQR